MIWMLKGISPEGDFLSSDLATKPSSPSSLVPAHQVAVHASTRNSVFLGIVVMTA
jgi:hypothetical protein